MRPRVEPDRPDNASHLDPSQAGARSRPSRRRVIPPANPRAAASAPTISTPILDNTPTKLSDAIAAPRPRPRTATSGSSRSNTFTSISSATPKLDSPPLLLRDSSGSLVQQIPQVSIPDPTGDADSECPAEDAEQEIIARDARLSGQVQEYLAKHNNLALWDVYGPQQSAMLGTGGAGRHLTRGQTHAVDAGEELAEQVMNRLREVVGDKLVDDKWRYESTGDVFARQMWA